jgi:DNA-binding MarR family transcriptional regulator
MEAIKQQQQTTLPDPTPRQLQVLEEIDIYRARCGVSPTCQEIGELLQINRVTAHLHIAALEEKGYLKRHRRQGWRSYRLTEAAEQLLGDRK